MTNEERIQRRLAAILAADIVGFSGRVRSDEEATLRQVKDSFVSVLRPKISSHGGRVFKEVGDGLLAEFASIVDAVRCGVEIQQEIQARDQGLPSERRLAFRIGINLGDIVIDGDDILGDGVNLASRLEGLADPGCVCISEDAFRQIDGKLRLPFADRGVHEIKGLPAPIRVYHWSSSEEADSPAAAGGPTPEASGKPAIVVLPFEAFGSTEKSDDIFADGITEDIITELSRYAELDVIARNSAFTYKGRAVKVQDVRRDLAVDYLVEGSVRRAGNRIRVTVQLIDTRTGAHLWAERYDRELVDIFDVQDELTTAIVAILPGRLGAAERQRAKRKPPQDMAAFDYFYAGKLCHHRVTAQDNIEAQRLLAKAIELDPEFAEAHAWLACTLGQALQFGFVDDPQEVQRQAQKELETALALDENSVECHRLLCEVNMEFRDLEEAIAHGELAFSLNPNDPRLLAQKGELLTWQGRPEEGVKWIGEAMRLDPHGAHGRSHLLGRALYGCRRYADAYTAFKRLRSPNFGQLATMAACLAQSEPDADTGSLVERVLALKPDFSIEAFLAKLPFAHEEDRRHLAEGMEKAGLPG